MKRLLLTSLVAALVAGCEPSNPIALAANTAGSTPPAPTSPVSSSIPTPTTTNPPSAPETVSIAVTNSVPIQPLLPPSPPPELPAPAQQVLRLSQTAVGESVVLSYIASIQEPFSLDVDQIIYLSDLGLGEAPINALVRRATANPAPVPAPVQNVVVNAQGLLAASQPEPVLQTANVPTAPGNVILTNYLASTAGGHSGGFPGAPVPAAPAPVYGTPQPGPAQAAPATVIVQQQPVSHNVFHESLSPYGSWVQIEPYGWCWQPAVVAVNPGWRPYVDGGQWLWSDVGWYWQSSYSWGWAPFHYGRWHRNTRVGWLWVPGADWGPAWVSWRWTDAHCGWAPLPPECRWSSQIGFSWFSGNTAVSIGFGLWDDCWYATSWNRFCDPGLPGWGLGRHQVSPFVRNSRNAIGGDNSVNIVGNNNTVIINNGIPRDQVQRHTRGEIRKHSITDAAQPGLAASRSAANPGAARPQIAAYRPRVDSQSASAASAPPTAILARQEARKAGPGSSFAPARPNSPNRANPSLGVAAPARPTSSPAPRSSLTPARPMGKVGEPSSRPAPTAPLVSSPSTRPGGNLAPARPIPSRPTPMTSPSTVPGANLGSPRTVPQPARPTTQGVSPNNRLAAPLYSQPAYNSPAGRPIPNRSAPAQIAPQRPITTPQATGPRTEWRKPDTSTRSPMAPVAPSIAPSATPSRPGYSAGQNFQPRANPGYSQPARPNPTFNRSYNTPSTPQAPAARPSPVPTPSRSFTPPPAAPSRSFAPSRPSPAPSRAAPSPVQRSQPTPQSAPRGKPQDR